MADCVICSGPASRPSRYCPACRTNIASKGAEERARALSRAYSGKPAFSTIDLDREASPRWLSITGRRSPARMGSMIVWATLISAMKLSTGDKGFRALVRRLSGASKPAGQPTGGFRP